MRFILILLFGYQINTTIIYYSKYYLMTFSLYSDKNQMDLYFSDGCFFSYFGCFYKIIMHVLISIFINPSALVFSPNLLIMVIMLSMIFILLIFIHYYYVHLSLYSILLMNMVL